MQEPERTRSMSRREQVATELAWSQGVPWTVVVSKAWQPKVQERLLRTLGWGATSPVWN